MAFTLQNAFAIKEIDLRPSAVSVEPADGWQLRVPTVQDTETYCSPTSTGTSPTPCSSGAKALPMTAPNARTGSSAFIA